MKTEKRYCIQRKYFTYINYGKHSEASTIICIHTCVHNVHLLALSRKTEIMNNFMLSRFDSYCKDDGAMMKEVVRERLPCMLFLDAARNSNSDRCIED
jgi:hypothetical protein